MVKKVNSIKVHGLKTMSKEAQILKYADESRRFFAEAKGVKAVLSLLVRELVKHPQFGAVREQAEQHLSKDNPTLAATAIREHLEQSNRGSGGVVMPDESFLQPRPDSYQVTTYGGIDTDEFFEARPTDDNKSSNPTVIIPDGSFLQPKPIEEKSNDKKSSVLIPGFEAITY